MNYASVCSGIEAPSVAWEPLGWEPQWFSEIEPFPCSVLAHHYPDVPNLGDMTKIHETETFRRSAIDLLIGGTPCQSFSLAGLRKGLDDPRGNLMLTFLSLIDRKRPRWVVWENVPGVLSSWSDAEEDQDGGIWQTNDFDTFLSGLRQLGYGVAWRILDAQYYGVAQRRRRVFVVGYPGDWRPAAAVLFERYSLQGYPPPRRKTGQETTEIAGTLTANGGGTTRPAGNANELDFCIPVYASTGEVSHCLNAGGMGRQDFESETIISECYGIDEECNATDNHFGPLLRGGQGGTRQAVAYRTAGDGGIYEEGDRTAALTTGTDRSANIVTVPDNVGVFMAGQGAKAGGIGYSTDCHQP